MPASVSWSELPARFPAGDAVICGCYDRGVRLARSSILLAAALVAGACEKEPEPAPREPVPTPNTTAEAAPVPKPPTGLPAALARGISPPSLDDGTYRVDPFVAVVLYERLAADLAPLSRVEAQGPAPSGYRVGTMLPEDVLARLGLQEGDIVEALNGVSIGDAAALELALDAAENRMTVTIFREDLSFTNSYRFEGGLAWRDVIAGDEPTPGEAEAPSEPAEDVSEPASVEPPEPPPPTTPRKRTSKPQRTPKNTQPSTPRSSVPKPSGIRCASAASCTITRRAFDDLRASPSALQSGVDIVPAIRNDVFSGYKLKRVSSRSPIHALGFRAGDKITHVNGRDLTDDAQAMALYWSLGSSKLFKVRYERGGRRKVKTIRVV